MKIFSFMLHFITFFSLILSDDEKCEKKPLVFNPYTRETYESEESALLPFTTACSAESKSEQRLDNSQSIYNKGIFVRKTYYVKGELRSRTNTKCERSYEFAATYKFNTDTIEFGYEVYYRRFSIRGKVNSSTFSKYRSGFIWIPKIILKYDSFSWIMLQAQYTIHRNHPTNIKCDDNNLGIEFFQQKYHNYRDLYLSHFQEKIFENFILSKFPENSACVTEKTCVKEYNMLKLHYQSSPESPVSCSDLTSIPILFDFNETLLDRSENFLIKIAKIINDKLTIYSGTYEILRMPRISQGETSEKSDWEDIYLYESKNKIPIPKIIYKIVSYQPFDCNANKIICIFYVTIVIHNEPEFTEDEKLCEEDKCKEWGWDSIQYLSVQEKQRGKKSQHIYCCQLTKDLEKLLEFKKAHKLHGDLKLNSLLSKFGDFQRITEEIMLEI